ncbi:MAG: glycerol-3-phosphate dehydrogenase C-terminal domain-containing protein [Caulobacteraceae bacterium]
MDRIEAALGRKVSACRTAEAPLPGGDVDVASARSSLEHGGLAAIDADRLVSLYGAEAAAIAADGGDITAEARHAVLAEGALTLEDYWVRRSARAWFAEGGGLGDLAPAADAMGHLLGRSDAERRARSPPVAPSTTATWPRSRRKEHSFEHRRPWTPWRPPSAPTGSSTTRPSSTLAATITGR